MYLLPFQKFLRLSKVQVWIEGPTMKDKKYDQTLIPCWEYIVSYYYLCQIYDYSTRCSSWKSFLGTDYLPIIYENLDSI